MSAREPLTNGRDRSGRFTAGNRFGRGNPHFRTIARLRMAVARAVTADDVLRVLRALADRAVAGDIEAAKLYLERVLGKPMAEPPDPDRTVLHALRLEAEHWRLEGELHREQQQARQGELFDLDFRLP